MNGMKHISNITSKKKITGKKVKRTSVHIIGKGQELKVFLDTEEDLEFRQGSMVRLSRRYKSLQLPIGLEGWMQ